MFLLCALWLAAFVFSVSSFTFPNDLFDRVSRARQIARYGEWPFSDFLDPGYYMTEFVSAGLQLLLGDSLLGDVLLSSVFIASGTAVVAFLCWRVSQSLLVALGASVLALLALPRGYDFDKVLFYPLAVALIWRYVDVPTTRRIWALAAGAVIAALFRYDTGVYFIAATVVAIVVVHSGDRVVLFRRLGLLAVAVGALSLPILLALQVQTGVLDVVDQVLTYGRQEGAGTRIETLPSISLKRPFGLSTLPPPSKTVTIRWQETVDDESRKAAEVRHTLVDGVSREGPDSRTWKYRIEDSSTASLRAILDDSAVADVSGIERRRVGLTPEPWWTRAQRAAPILRVRLFPGAWNPDTAKAILFYLFHGLPLVGIFALTLKTRAPMPASRDEIARVASLIVLCIILNLVILRNPLSARIGGMIGPAAILAVWLARCAWRAPQGVAQLTLRTVTVVTLCLTVWSVSVAANWQTRLTLDLARPSRFVRALDTAAVSPPDPDVVGSRTLTTLVGYLRNCTRPTDRILVTFFAPEIPFFAQRGFAGGLATLAGGHWSEPRFQERSIRYLASHPPALIIQRSGDNGFGQTYPLLERYLSEHYRAVGTLQASSEESFPLLVQNDRAATSTHLPSALPCFQ